MFNEKELEDDDLETSVEGAGSEPPEAVEPVPAPKVSELWEVTDAKSVLVRDEKNPRYELQVTLKPKGDFSAFAKGDVVSLEKVLGQ